jgi:hypothetical protein
MIMRNMNVKTIHDSALFFPVQSPGRMRGSFIRSAANVSEGYHSARDRLIDAHFSSSGKLSD